MDNLIYNQKKIPKDQWRYGLRASAATGCGWIAAYNALCLMGYRPKAEKVIEWFERNFPVLNGNLGTFVLTPAAFFKKLGFSVKIINRRSQYDAAVKGSDAALLFYYWRKKLKFGIHFVALQHRDGRFYGCNTYRNSNGLDDYGESLETFLKTRQFFCTILIAIKDKK